MIYYLMKFWNKMWLKLELDSLKLLEITLQKLITKFVLKYHSLDIYIYIYIAYCFIKRANDIISILIYDIILFDRSFEIKSVWFLKNYLILHYKSWKKFTVKLPFITNIYMYKTTWLLYLLFYQKRKWQYLLELFKILFLKYF